MADDREIRGSESEGSASAVLDFTLPEAPRLWALQTRRCTVEELQAALVALVEIHNETARRLSSAIADLDSRKADREWGLP